MLKIQHIEKSYLVGDQHYPALRGVSMSFQSQEFVSILGESGSGKTTLLNIIGGLDRYTKGDLEIQGVSTKSFKDADWDAYRNTTIGFVFQSYNLIAHLSVLDNVDMSLRLINMSSKERRIKAKQVLTEVGLKDHMYKKPSQLSGGQQQRVAIARALVNDPKILLADEPTGALDSVTSEQIMQLIKHISKDRLVIMVTHNHELAEKYSDRIIELKDGEVIRDSKPVELKKTSTLYQASKVSMSFNTAVKTSFQNLLTKKARTLITTFAGSIGIIGVALVLALSNGMTNYVSVLESDSLAGFPISISDVISTNEFGPGGSDSPFSSDDSMLEPFTEDNIIYAYDREASTTLHDNLITESYLNYIDGLDPSLYNSITYTQSMQMTAIIPSLEGTYEEVVISNQTTLFNQVSFFQEMPSSSEFVLSQYDVLYGTYPTSIEDIVLFVDENNQIDIRLLSYFGLTSSDYQFEDIIGLTLKLIPNQVLYEEVGDLFIRNTDLEAMYASNEAITLTVSAVMRVKESASSDIIGTGIGYQASLTDQMLNFALQSDVVIAQQNNLISSVLTGLPFNDYVSYEDTLGALGGQSLPIGLEIYPVSFEAKDIIKAYLDDYNEGLLEEDVILYTDTAEVISSTITSLIDTITIVLTALAAVSLVVSSIMIGIITYVSVVERTKEIGIMRSLGARKKDIRRIFNAETLLIGLSAGMMGILVTLILSIPVNTIISNLIEVENIAQLTLTHALSLITLSALLTLLAGLIPSGIAAKRDPVTALRSE